MAQTSDTRIAESALTVGELRVALADLPDDMIVTMSKDAEGNGYSPLAWAEEAMYDPESAYSGEAYPTPEELAVRIGAGEGGWTQEDAAPEGAVRVLLLGPIN